MVTKHFILPVYTQKKWFHVQQNVTFGYILALMDSVLVYTRKMLVPAYEVLMSILGVLKGRQEGTYPA